MADGPSGLRCATVYRYSCLLITISQYIVSNLSCVDLLTNSKSILYGKEYVYLDLRAYNPGLFHGCGVIKE